MFLFTLFSLLHEPLLYPLDIPYHFRRCLAFSSPLVRFSLDWAWYSIAKTLPWTTARSESYVGEDSNSISVVGSIQIHKSCHYIGTDWTAENVGVYEVYAAGLWVDRAAGVYRFTTNEVNETNQNWTKSYPSSVFLFISVYILSLLTGRADVIYLLYVRLNEHQLGMRPTSCA